MKISRKLTLSHKTQFKKVIRIKLVDFFLINKIIIKMMGCNKTQSEVQKTNGKSKKEILA